MRRAAAPFLRLCRRQSRKSRTCFIWRCCTIISADYPLSLAFARRPIIGESSYVNYRADIKRTSRKYRNGERHVIIIDNNNKYSFSMLVCSGWYSRWLVMMMIMVRSGSRSTKRLKKIRPPTLDARQTPKAMTRGVLKAAGEKGG